MALRHQRRAGDLVAYTNRWPVSGRGPAEGLGRRTGRSPRSVCQGRRWPRSGPASATALPFYSGRQSGGRPGLGRFTPRLSPSARERLPSSGSDALAGACADAPFCYPNPACVEPCRICSVVAVATPLLAECCDLYSSAFQLPPTLGFQRLFVTPDWRPLGLFFPAPLTSPAPRGNGHDMALTRSGVPPPEDLAGVPGEVTAAWERRYDEGGVIGEDQRWAGWAVLPWRVGGGNAQPNRHRHHLRGGHGR
jgi:hypothetical protein